MINPKNTNKSNSRQDQSLLTAVVYKDNYFGYLPKIKKIFGIRVNQNPNQDFFFSPMNIMSIQEKLYFDWYKHYKNISTKTINYSKIIWV